MSWPNWLRQTHRTMPPRSGSGPAVTPIDRRRRRRQGLLLPLPRPLPAPARSVHRAARRPRCDVVVLLSSAQLVVAVFARTIDAFIETPPPPSSPPVSSGDLVVCWVGRFGRSDARRANRHACFLLTGGREGLELTDVQVDSWPGYSIPGEDSCKHKRTDGVALQSEVFAYT